MLIENEFTVATPIDELWSFLLDVERIAPCMPGAELTETVDDTTWKGKVTMKFGPVAMSFAGTVEMAERDDTGRRAVLRAKGMEQRGKGAANATVTSWLEPADGDRTTVKMTADITLSGAAAQMSRGLLPEISKKLTQQFADCLEATIGASGDPSAPVAESAAAAETPAPASAPLAGASAPAGEVSAPADTPAPPVTSTPERPASTAPATAPVGGIRLGLSAIWSLIAGFFRRLFGGGDSTST
jgi:carbon monoxide dehydrogenase subunit G